MPNPSRCHELLGAFGFCIIAASCGGESGPGDMINPTPTPSPQPQCVADANCSDGEFCNGAERCQTGTCAPGAVPCLSDAVCREDLDTCAINEAPAVTAGHRCAQDEEAPCVAGFWRGDDNDDLFYMSDNVGAGVYPNCPIFRHAVVIADDEAGGFLFSLQTDAHNASLEADGTLRWVYSKSVDPANRTYTFTRIVTDSRGVSSQPYTIQVFIRDDRCEYVPGVGWLCDNRCENCPTSPC